MDNLQPLKNLLFILLLSLVSCSPDSNGGRVIVQEEKPEAGFSYPYCLFIPETLKKGEEAVLIVEPNNSGFASDIPDEHLEKAKRTAGREFYTGNYVARKLEYPLLVPVFPRPKSEWKIYTHAFDRDAALQKGNSLERIDMQLLAMVEDARTTLQEQGYRIGNQFLMTGFSASGTFVNRFTAVHPDKVLAAAAGGLNGLLILPVNEMDSIPLNFPLGVNDFPSLFNKTFDTAAYKTTPQFLFMGELDENDAIPYEDGYDDDERDLVYKVLGREMMPVRWNKCREVYRQSGIDATLITLPDVGHSQPDSVKEMIVEFFRKHVDSGS